MDNPPDAEGPVVVRRRRRSSGLGMMLVATFLPTVTTAAVWYWFIRDEPAAPPPDLNEPTPSVADASVDGRNAVGSETRPVPSNEPPGGLKTPAGSDVASTDTQTPGSTFGDPLPNAPTPADPGELASIIPAEPTEPVSDNAPVGPIHVTTPEPGEPETAIVRQAVPDDAECEASRKQVRELFRDKFLAARTPELKHALATELYQLGIDTDDDPAARYALLNEAIDLAVEVGDFASALRTIGDISSMYEIDRVGRALEVVQDASPVVRLPADATKLTEACLLLTEYALEESRFEVADLAVRIATTNATRSKILILRQSVTEMKRHVAEREAAWKVAEEARATLETSPDDPAAHEQLGIWLAFVQNDWPAARQHLVRSEDPLVRAVVALEMATPASADQQADVARRWQAAAKARTDLTKARFLLRAVYWLQTAADQTSGLKAAQLKQQIDELDRQTLGSERTWLADLKPVEVRTVKNWGVGIGITGNRYNNPIVVNGQKYPRGLGTHPHQDGDGYVRYVLDAKYRTFAMQCSIPTGVKPRGELQFSVLGDGKLLWQSRRVNKSDIVQGCQVNVRGVRVLELRTKAYGNTFGAVACWLDPFLLKSEPPKGVELH